MRVFLLGVVLTGCANVASEATVDAWPDVEDTGPGFDTAESFDFSTPDALADATRLDAASCATRTEACGSLSSDPLMRVLDACLKVEWSCGKATFAVDEGGCVTAVAFDRASPDAKFRACVVEELATQRFACIMSGTHTRRFEDCTVK